MKKQFILTAALLISALGYINANEIETNKILYVPADVEVSAEASAPIRININIERSGANFCLSAGTGCTINIDITIDIPFLMNARFDKIDASSDGKVMEGFQFDVAGPAGPTTYTVPTQVLNWNGDGFTMVYQ